MIKLKQAVIVEGKYDKIKLKSIIDAPIITTDGFGIFKNREKMALIKSLAQKRGIIIMTDSDSAGFMIRKKICGSVKSGRILNVYIPDIFGKERRKAHSSKEGKLGVEGVPKDVILTALKRAGVTSTESVKSGGEITKADLFELGLSGRPNSAQKRLALLKSLNLPENMTANSLLEVLNIFFTKEEFLSTQFSDEW
ncbi:MAG: DUF4093 domain-containing protein [Acutalibacteraceae bacterium]|nr:DUF4093 domain-containing protein [Acutalibacteraceae bacterium]